MTRPAAAPRADTVAVIGGGKMGSEIAAAMAAGGWDAHVCEPDAAVRAALPHRWREILRAVGAPRGALERLRSHAALEDLPWRDVKLVVEAAPEQLALKRRLFRRIEALAPARAILTTNSSSLRVSDIATAVERRERLAALHWMPPVHVVPIVEIVRGAGTAPATIRRLNAWMTALGKLPVNLAQDVPGMLVNRLQHAMLREAYDLMDRGVVQAEDIDRAVRFGFGFRYVGCGPLRQRDINGLVIHHQSAAQIYPTLHGGRRPARGFTALVKSGRVGARAGGGFYRWDPATLAAYLQDYERCLGKALDLAKALPEPVPARAGRKSRPQRGRKA